jgi:hypothetical protein
MKRRILWRSDFRLFTACCAIWTIVCLVSGLNHVFATSQPENAVVSAFVGSITLTLGLYFGLTEDEVIRRTWRIENVEEAKKEALKHSFLNRENIPPDKRNPPPGMIG